MSSETIQISTDDGVAEAYVTSPDDEQHPGVLFYMDAIGLRPRLHDMADRIASWGYTVMVPNVFYRAGTADELAPHDDLRVPEHRDAFFEGAMPLVGRHTAEESRRDLEAYLDTLLGLSGVPGQEIGVTGYCMGGRLAIRAAGQRPESVVAVGAFHAGGLVTDEPDSPHLALASARAEIFAGHADNDRSNPPEAVATLEATMDSAGLTYTSEVFAGAPHGYSMSDTSMYDEQATERHFRELEALLGRAVRG